MAKVKMSLFTDDKYMQETWAFVYEYTYCDQCGSFDVGLSSKLPANFDGIMVYITFGSIALGIGILIFFSAQWRFGCLAGLFGLGAFVLSVFTSFLKCNKCGNRQFTSGNVLNYAEGDYSVLDVLEESAMKKHVETIRV
jgi:hypothetical protein